MKPETRADEGSERCCWMLDVGCCCWLLVVGCWLLVVCFLLSVARARSRTKKREDFASFWRAPTRGAHQNFLNQKIGEKIGLIAPNTNCLR